MKLFSIIFLLIIGCGKGTLQDGIQGPPGAKGDKGDKGDTGAPATISSGVICSTIDTGSGTSLTYVYRSLNYTNGDRFVEAEIINSFTTSSTAVYKSTAAGATSGAINVTNTLSGDTYGYWRFTSQSGTTKVIYTSTGSVHNQYTYTFIDSNCSFF